MPSDEYDLSVSSKRLGKLYPILKDKTGNVIDGFHRQNADPEWPCVTVESVDSPVKLELARLASNFCRREIPESEMRQRISFLIKNGLKPEEISDQTGISKTTIYKYMPQEAKDPQKVEAGKVSGEVRSVPHAEHTVTIQDIVSCDRCHVSTSTPVRWHDHNLCESCHQKALLIPQAFDGYFRYLEKGRQPTVTEASPRDFDSWTQKKAVMTPGVSKMDEAVYLALQNNEVLRDAGWKFEFQKHYCIKEVVSDVTATRNDVEKPLFFDGDIHVGREDRDEANRALLDRRLKSLAFAYSGDYSDAKRDEMATKIEKTLLEILAVVKTEA